MVTQCCVCKRVKNDNGEYEIKNALADDIASHGYCPKCKEMVLNQFKKRMEMEKEIQENMKLIEGIKKKKRLVDLALRGFILFFVFIGVVYGVMVLFKLWSKL